jgi:hypothetical protein
MVETVIRRKINPSHFFSSGWSKIMHYFKVLVLALTSDSEISKIILLRKFD